MRAHSIKVLEKDTAKSTASKHKAPCRRSPFELKYRLTPAQRLYSGEDAESQSLRIEISVDKAMPRSAVRSAGRSPFELKHRLTDALGAPCGPGGVSQSLRVETSVDTIIEEDRARSPSLPCSPSSRAPRNSVIRPRALAALIREAPQASLAHR